jgi:hypothetical protein
MPTGNLAIEARSIAKVFHGAGGRPINAQERV